MSKNKLPQKPTTTLKMTSPKLRKWMAKASFYRKTTQKLERTGMERITPRLSFLAKKPREKNAEGETSRKVGRFKRLTKKQLRLQEERLEEEQEREERRKRREERRRKKEEQAELARQQAPQSFDEAAFKDSIYTMVKSSLGLVMVEGGGLNITVDNLTPLMKGLELDTADEDVKELIMDALFNSYGLIEPQQIDQMLLKKKLQQELEQLEDCVDAAFAVIDQDRDGIITHNDVYRLMIHLGEVLWDNQVSAMLQAADVDGDGRISKKDLFLFLLGQEKTVKLEDQILNKLSTKDETGDGGEDSKTASTTDPAREETPAGAPKEAQQEQEEEEEDSKDASSPSEPPKTLAATVKNAQPTEESQASARRRKMFSGYAQMVISTNRLANSGSDSAGDATSLSEAVDSVGRKKEVRESEQEGKASPEAAVEEDSAEKDGEHQKLPAGKEEPREKDASAQGNKGANRVPAVSVPGSDWSDSGHVGSDVAGDDFGEDNQEDEELECLPLALDAGICYLPAPEFDSLPGPLATPRSATSNSPCVTPSPRAARQGCQQGRDESMTPAPPDPADPELDQHQDPINSARTERTSEYDSDRDLDGDSLPETSHQNLILQEIEQQVLHTKEALMAREPSSGGGKLQDNHAAMIATDPGDGCESVVESEILPTYVPPCARYARSGLRLPSENLKDVAGDGVPGAGDKEHPVDTLTLDEYANSTAEIVSKGFVSLSSPRSLSTLTTKPRQQDNSDDVFPAPCDACPQCHFPAPCDACPQCHFPAPCDACPQCHFPAPCDACPQCHFPAAFNTPFTREAPGDGDGSITQPGGYPRRREEEAEVGDEDFDDSSFQGQSEAPVDGAPPPLRPACDRARKLSARSRPKSSLRRSLACHTVTVKDLSAFVHRSLSPQNRDKLVYAPRRPFARSRSSHLKQSDSPRDGRESSLRRRHLSVDRTDTFVTREETPAPTPLSSRRPQSFSFRRTQSLGRASSPQGGHDSPGRRMYSPVSRVDSHRHQSIDTSRTQRESSRGRTTLPLSYRESARTTHRESSRSGRETGRSQLESHRNRQESFRARSASGLSTARSAGPASSSVYDEEDESEEDFKFYGPNFDVIMSQKGEPEELLRESLLRDALFRAGAQPPPPQEGQVETVPHDDDLPAVEIRKMKISRQLDRVKEMERLIMQRRGQVPGDGSEGLSLTEDATQIAAPTHGGRRHPLRRARTAMSMRTPHTFRPDYTDALVSKNSSGTVRPRSCLARRRTMSTSAPKVVTIADSGEAPHPRMAFQEPCPTNPATETTTADAGETSSQPAVHVVDLSSLLSGVSEAEPTADTTKAPPPQKTGSQSIRPLARVLVAFERARRRQAGTASSHQHVRGQPPTTSISRQLQQGIPYRPPTPPHFSEPCSQSHPSHVPRCSSAHVRKCSFMLGSLEASCSQEERPALIRSEAHHATTKQRQRMSRRRRSRSQSASSERIHSDGDRASTTMEFPERSVCVVKSRPATATAAAAAAAAAAPSGSA